MSIDAPDDAPPLSLVQLFDRVAAAHGDRVAVELPPTAAGPARPQRHVTTYAQLRQRADALASALKPVAGADEIVAILLGRDTASLYAAQLGVLKAGMAFTCLDPRMPDDHLRRVLSDARPRALISDAIGLGRLRTLTQQGLAIDVDDPAPLPAAASGAADRGASSPSVELRSSDLAYVIYTSGTTGMPKGVMIEHAGLANLVHSDIAYFGLTPDDRVGQCSSPAYDSSLEESWLAFAVGATLVVLDDDTVRLGPDLVPWLRRERITVLCPPPTLLRSTGCDDPLMELPDLRLLYVGGEALPRDLADRWALGRWMENGYGPTECTITVTRGRVRAGEEVTIGRPVSGHCAYLLVESSDDEAPAGEAGELCIAGPGLSRGYHGLPELTAEKFPVHPGFGRIYRTGDLVRRRDDGELEYLGRIDGQVKLRGYRVELAAIEAELARLPGVRAAGCRVQTDGPAGQMLAAHVVPADPLRPPDAAELRAGLRRVLPEYMVPARLGFLDVLPTTVGGKLDRRALPEVAGVVPAAAAASGAAHPAASSTALSGDECRIAEAFSTALGQPAGGLHDDFFLDLGGDSLSAVAVICALRKSAPDSTPVTVRDLYEARTIARLSQRLRRTGGESSTGRNGDDAGTTIEQAGALPEAEIASYAARVRPAACTAAQALWLVILLVLVSVAAALLASRGASWIVHKVGLAGGLLLTPLLGIVALLAYTPFSVMAAALGKRLLIGRYRAGRVPVWGGLYLRHWIVVRLSRLIPWWLLEGTILNGMALRMLGARVGRRVYIHRGVDLAAGGWDLLAIGDDVTVAQDAELRTVDLAQGHIVFGHVRIGDGATVDVRAGLSPGSRIEANGHLTALSWLAPGAVVGAGERWDGVPARRAGGAPDRPPLASDAGKPSPAAHAGLAVALRCARLLAAWLIPAIGLSLLAVSHSTFAARAVSWLEDPSFSPGPIALLPAIVAPSLACWLVFQAVLLRFGPRARPGVISQWSAAAILVHLKAGVVEAAGRWLSGSLFWPWWLRLAGMRIGCGCEISTIIDVVPELVTVADECFFADGIYFCSPWRHRGTLTLGAATLGPRTFLGNHAVVPGGHAYPAGLFVGVSTVADRTHARPETAWFGHPPIPLPRREVLAADRRLTHNPGGVRYVNRLFWEALRLALPTLPILGACAWYALLVRMPWGGALPQSLLIAPLVTLGLLAGLCLAVVLLKWLLLGRAGPGQHPLWSCWCSRWDFLYVAWGEWARGTLAHLEGTLLLNAVLRLVGMRIGRRVVLGPGFAQVVDPDMIEIADDATVACHFQAHSFEDRILKIDRVRIGVGATVGDNAVVFYRVDIGAGAHVLPHSVVMKGDVLPAGGRFAGAPVVPLVGSPNRKSQAPEI